MSAHPLLEGFSPKPGSSRGGSDKKPSRLSLHPLPSPINEVDAEAPGTQRALRHAHLRWKQISEDLQKQRGLRHIALGGTMIVVGIGLAITGAGDPMTTAQATAQAGAALGAVFLTVIGIPVTIYGFLENKLKDDDEK